MPPLKAIPCPKSQDAPALPRTFPALLLAIAALTAANLLFHGMHVGMDLYRGRWCEDAYLYFPGPLFHGSDRFMDYFNMQRFLPEQGQTSALPPGLILLYGIARLLTHATSPGISIVVFSLFQFGFFAYSVARVMESVADGSARTDLATRTAVALSLCLISYPVIVAIDRGNFALTVCSLIALAAAAHLRGDRWHAAAWIGLAAALRITPLVFAAIYLGRRDFRYLLAAVVVAMAATAVALFPAALIFDGYSLQTWLDGFDGHSFMYTTWTNGLSWSSSLYNLVRFVRYLDGIPIDSILETAARAERTYSAFAAVVLGLVVWKIRKVDPVTALTLLSLAFVALPHVTGDYYLAALIVPLVMIASQARIDYPSLILLVLLLVPKDYFYYYFHIHKISDIKVHDFAEYVDLLIAGYKPSSIQSLVINPVLMILLGARLLLKRSGRATELEA